MRNRMRIRYGRRVMCACCGHPAGLHGASGCLKSGQCDCRLDLTGALIVSTIYDMISRASAIPEKTHFGG